jgi:N-alpha-acetyl-L-2,4-diaminobutyrate deacetylase
MSTTVSCSINLDTEGKSAGYLVIGDSTNKSGWANFHVPIIKIKNGVGPTVLILAGNHGDEYEGQFAAREIAQELEAKDVTGRIIVIPCLSQEAAKAATRLWPDGTNFNRIFPGDESGAVHGKLAYYLSSALFPIVDAVLELHSGGRGHYFIPCATMVWARDVKQRAKMMKSMISFNAPHQLILPEQPGTDPKTLLSGMVEHLGKELVTTELGGAGIATLETTNLAKDGVRNSLRYLKVIKGEPKTRAELGLPSANCIDLRGSNSYHLASDFGVYENVKGVGDSVEEGEIIGLIHNMDSPNCQPAEIRARQTGMVGVMRGFPRVTPGDVVAVIGKSYSAPDQLPETVA